MVESEKTVKSCILKFKDEITKNSKLIDKNLENEHGLAKKKETQASNVEKFENWKEENTVIDDS